MMKSISILALLASLICPISSQPHQTTTSNTTPTSTSTSIQSSAVPSACNDKHITISDQLAEITYLKSKSLPITHDLAGYFYVILVARKLMGCPPIPLLNFTSSSTKTSSRPLSLQPSTSQPSSSYPSSSQTSSSSSSQPSSSQTPSSQPSKRSTGSASQNPCSVVRALRTQVQDQLDAMDENEIGAPDYLAGWFSGTHDLNQGWSCGLPPMPAEPGHHNSTVSDEE